MEMWDFLKQIKEYMNIHHMTDEGDGILVAVSGGADSVCLLLVLSELSQELGIRLAAFHLNHGLRGEEADRDERYVQELCRTLGIPLEVWLGVEAYTPSELSADAYEVARAYDRADFRDKNMTRMALKLELLKEEKV